MDWAVECLSLPLSLSLHIACPRQGNGWRLVCLIPLRGQKTEKKKIPASLMGWPNCWMRRSIITKRSHPSNSQQLVWCHGTYAYLNKNLKTPSDSLARSPKTPTQKIKVGEERKSYWKIIRPHTKRKKKNQQQKLTPSWRYCLATGEQARKNAADSSCLVAAQMFVLVCRCCRGSSLCRSPSRLARPFSSPAPII